MAAKLLTIAILLINRVKPQINITSTYQNYVNTNPDGTSEAVFALQIRQIRTTSEATPAAAAGNNLNVVGATDSLPLQTENFQAISTIYSSQNKTSANKKHAREKNLILQSTDKSRRKKEKANIAENPIGNAESQPLVWDGCLETKLDEPKSEVYPQKDMESSYRDIQVNSNFQPSNIWNKRNAVEDNSTAAMKAWLERYNILKNSRKEERRQQKQDSVLLRKLSPAPTNAQLTTMKMVPITRNIFDEPSDDYNMTLDMSTENSILKAGYTEDWFVVKDRPTIRFGGLPPIETYLISTLKLEEGFHPFGFMSGFFSIIYPFDFPVGLIKDIVWGKFTFPYSFLQSIKIESTFLGFIIFFTCVALVIPAYLLVLGILYLLSSTHSADELERGALFPDSEDSKCNDRVVVIATLFVVLLCCLFISGMAVSNEQARTAADESRNVFRCACADMASWLASAARDLHYSLVPPADLMMQAYRDDLRNVERLLGEPIQQAIASESGIDMVLDSFADIIQESEDLSSKISSLRDLSIRAGSLSSSTSDRLRDMARQLDNLKKHCNQKDIPLCDTINTNSLELMLKFDLILHEQQLLELRSLGVENMTRAISIARQQFRVLPSAISTQTAPARNDILKDIESRRQHVHMSSRVLGNIVRHLTAGLHSIARKVDTGLERVQRYDFWRWSLMIACTVAFGFIMMLILTALLCGCGHAKGHAQRTLQLASIWLCFISLILWSIISAVFLIAGHAEVYVCHGLWDSPQYKSLSALLDKPSPLLANNEGIFDTIFRDLENVTIHVSVRDVIRDCERDHPAYIVFQLDKVLDVNKVTSYFEWVELQEDLERVTSSIDVGFLKSVSAYFNTLINEILTVSDVNLAKYRLDYNGPVVGKDLPSLVDQLENIAAQVSDLTTAGRLETLATRTQRLHITSIKPLEELKADIVFKLTELELQLLPFRRKLNISLSHIHTAQYYIDNQGDIIARKRALTYVSRLLSHTAGWRTHVLVTAGQHAARCRPLYTVFASIRALFCSNYVGSLHGWWFCGFLLGIFWCTTLTPLCVKLWRIYGRTVRAEEAMTLANLSSGHHETTPTTALCEASNWNTPGPPPPRSDSW